MSEEKEGKLIGYIASIGLSIVAVTAIIISSRGGFGVPTNPEDTSGNTTLTYVRNSTYSVKEDNKTYTSSVTTKGGTTVYLYGYNNNLPESDYVAKIGSSSNYYVLFARDTNGTPFIFQGFNSITISAYVGTTYPGVKIVQGKDEKFSKTKKYTVNFSPTETTKTQALDAGYNYLKIEGSVEAKIYSITLNIGCVNH